MRSVKKIAQILGVLVVLSALVGCEKDSQMNVDADKVASEVLSQANEPLVNQRATLWVKDVSTAQISKFSLAFVESLTKGKYEDARSFFSKNFQDKYPSEKLEHSFKKILKKTGKNTKVVKDSLIIDKTLVSAEKKGIADIYISVKGRLGLKALYVSLCNDSEQVKICHIGWGTEDSGEDVYAASSV